MEWISQKDNLCPAQYEHKVVMDAMLLNVACLNAKACYPPLSNLFSHELGLNKSAYVSNASV